MREVLRETESLCPDCLQRIPAWIVARDGNVFLEKHCQQHGFFSVIIWRDSAESYLQWGEYGGDRGAPGNGKPITGSELGCPFDCGICPEHEQGTASAAIMSTNRCNLNCPICFTNGGEAPIYEPGPADVKRMLHTVFDACGNIPIEFCGGEPTVRDDLPDLVRLAAQIGFDHIQINTNGIRIADDITYLEQLKEAAATTIYLQFDGIDDEIYQTTRGISLFARKCRALGNCSKVKIGVVLVPTIIRGVNFHQIGHIIRFATTWVPIVKGVYFQPVSFFGKYPAQLLNQDHVTIPDMLNAIEEQTQGEIKRINFMPPACEHPFCSFSGFFILRGDGKLSPTTQFRPRHSGEAGVEHAREFTRKYWRYREVEKAEPTGGVQKTAASFLRIDQLMVERSLFISGMLFQDVWNLDLARLKKCCIHIVTHDERMIPLCAKYLSSSTGERLYPGIA